MSTFSRRRQIADINTLHDEVRQFSEELGRTSVLLRDIISDNHSHETGQVHADEHGSTNHNHNMEPQLQAWLCVLGAFTFIIPSYGEPHNVSKLLHSGVPNPSLQGSWDPSASCNLISS